MKLKASKVLYDLVNDLINNGPPALYYTKPGYDEAVFWLLDSFNRGICGTPEGASAGILNEHGPCTCAASTIRSCAVCGAPRCMGHLYSTRGGKWICTGDAASGCNERARVKGGKFAVSNAYRGVEHYDLGQIAKTFDRKRRKGMRVVPIPPIPAAGRPRKEGLYTAGVSATPTGKSPDELHRLCSTLKQEGPSCMRCFVMGPQACDKHRAEHREKHGFSAYAKRLERVAPKRSRALNWSKHDPLVKRVMEAQARILDETSADVQQASQVTLRPGWDVIHSPGARWSKQGSPGPQVLLSPIQCVRSDGFRVWHSDTLVNNKGERMELWTILHPRWHELGGEVYAGPEVGMKYADLHFPLKGQDFVAMRAEARRKAMEEL